MITELRPSLSRSSWWPCYLPLQSTSSQVGVLGLYESPITIFHCPTLASTGSMSVSTGSKPTPVGSELRYCLRVEIPSLSPSRKHCWPCAHCCAGRHRRIIVIQGIHPDHARCELNLHLCCSLLVEELKSFSFSPRFSFAERLPPSTEQLVVLPWLLQPIMSTSRDCSNRHHRGATPGLR